MYTHSTQRTQPKIVYTKYTPRTYNDIFPAGCTIRIVYMTIGSQGLNEQSKMKTKTGIDFTIRRMDVIQPIRSHRHKRGVSTSVHYRSAEFLVRPGLIDIDKWSVLAINRAINRSFQMYTR